jgi:hypothetical protein
MWLVLPRHILVLPISTLGPVMCSLVLGFCNRNTIYKPKPCITSGPRCVSTSSIHLFFLADELIGSSKTGQGKKKLTITSTYIMFGVFFFFFFFFPEIKEPPTLFFGKFSESQILPISLLFQSIFVGSKLEG